MNYRQSVKSAQSVQKSKHDDCSHHANVSVNHEITRPTQLSRRIAYLSIDNNKEIKPTCQTHIILPKRQMRSTTEVKEKQTRQMLKRNMTVKHLFPHCQQGLRIIVYVQFHFLITDKLPKVINIQSTCQYLKS